jgi:hypothetical protein
MKATIEVEQNVNDIHTIAKALGGAMNNKTVTLEKVAPKEVETLLRKAGSKIASVHFKKRSNNELRKMCYRLGVKNPTSASRPKGGNASRKDVNKKNKQMTVFDVNKVCRDRQGNIKYDENGKQLRGAWRTVPLENVTRVCVDGVVYEINS